MKLHPEGNFSECVRERVTYRDAINFLSCEIRHILWLPIHILPWSRQHIMKRPLHTRDALLLLAEISCQHFAVILSKICILTYFAMTSWQSEVIRLVLRMFWMCDWLGDWKKRKIVVYTQVVPLRIASLYCLSSPQSMLAGIRKVTTNTVRPPFTPRHRF